MVGAWCAVVLGASFTGGSVFVAGLIGSRIVSIGMLVFFFACGRLVLPRK